MNEEDSWKVPEAMGGGPTIRFAEDILGSPSSSPRRGGASKRRSGSSSNRKGNRGRSRSDEGDGSGDISV